jgi:acetyltransferase-like isoleucine patch superfamily enzyme
MEIKENLQIGEEVFISQNSVIYPSVRGSKIKIGSFTQIYDFVCIKCVGGLGDITIGENCFLNPGTVIYSGNGVSIGNFVLMAPGCAIIPTNHEYKDKNEFIRNQGFRPSKGGVIIGNDVWLGANTVVLDGSVIGDGSIIAANSVVNCEVPPFEIWGSEHGKIKKIKNR